MIDVSMLGSGALMRFQALVQLSWHRRAVPTDMLSCRCSPDWSCATSRKLRTRRVTSPGWTAQGGTRTSDESRRERVACEGPCTSLLSQPGGNAQPRERETREVGFTPACSQGHSAEGHVHQLVSTTMGRHFLKDIGCVAHHLQLALEPPLRRHLQRPASSLGSARAHMEIWKALIDEMYQAWVRACAGLQGGLCWDPTLLHVSRHGRACLHMLGRKLPFLRPSGAASTLALVMWQSECMASQAGPASTS